MKIFKAWWLLNKIQYLFRHRHKREVTHVNTWQHPTRQVCKCGISREIKSASKLMCIWKHSDGGESDEFDHFSSHKY